MVMQNMHFISTNSQSGNYRYVNKQLVNSENWCLF